MTQGLVTIRAEGKVQMKIVAGCEGMKASKMAAAIRAMREVPTLNDAYALAKRLGFGDRASLVVITKTETKYEGDEELSNLYRRTFDDPHFNPRWDRGTADFTEVVDLDF